MCDKAIFKCLFLFGFIPDLYKTQKMCDIVSFDDTFLKVQCPDEYITQRMHDEAIDSSLGALKPILDWFVTSKMIDKLYTALYADENVLYFNENPGDAIFPCNVMGILSTDLNNINLDNNFDEDDSDTIILIRRLAWHIKF